MRLNPKILLDKIIWFSYVALAVFTPLIFTTSTTELFEIPKMLIVYGLTSIILTLTLFKTITDKKISLPAPTTPTLILIFTAFLAFQALSTFFSIDKFTSIYGYPTRLNGGLLSQLSYFILFTCALINLNKTTSYKLLATSIITAFAVSLWGIPSHFGYDPNCLVLVNKLTADCWQAEFQPTLRIFSTLGQPNWLASYLVLTLPLSIALFLAGKTTLQKAVYLIASASIFLAFIFTNSRSGTAGMTITVIIFVALLGKKFLIKNKKIVIPATAAAVIVLMTFGSALFQRLKETQTGVTAGGTETSRIRAVVWQGAWQIFLNHPLLGTGPETFAYSYQKIRPLAHNQTTEWNFFYNKAHNEFLNYLANIGLVGFGAYLAFLFIATKNILQVSRVKLDESRSRQVDNSRLRSNNNQDTIIAKGAIAAIIGYQVTIFFGFSIVSTQTLMYLLIAQTLVIGNRSFKEIPLKLNRLQLTGLTLLTLLTGLWLLVSTFRLYFADVLLNRAKSTSAPSRSTQAFTNALLTFPTQNPFIASDFANHSAIYSIDFEDLSTSRQYADLSDSLAKRTIKTAPNNFLTIRRLVSSYTLIGPNNPKYQREGELLSQKLVQLAPTDPQSYYTVAKFYAAVGNQEELIKNLETALKLKPNYFEAQELLDQIQSKPLE